MQDVIRKKLISALLGLAYSEKCEICGSRAGTPPVCDTCWSSVERYEGPLCRVCGLPVVSELAGLCGRCTVGLPHFESARFHGLYDGTLREVINLFKFGGMRRMAGRLAALLAEVKPPASDVIASVPLGRKRLGGRGYNQSLLLSSELSRLTGVPLLTGVLLKVRETAPQVGLSAKERKKNVRGAFRADGSVRGKRVLLVDDVMTTGATADECSRTLIKAGAMSVNVLTLARAAEL